MTILSSSHDSHDLCTLTSMTSAEGRRGLGASHGRGRGLVGGRAGRTQRSLPLLLRQAGKSILIQWPPSITASVKRTQSVLIRGVLISRLSLLYVREGFLISRLVCCMRWPSLYSPSYHKIPICLLSVRANGADLFSIVGYGKFKESPFFPALSFESSF